MFLPESIGIESAKSFLRLVASKLVFPDTRSTVLVCLLVYLFRSLERRSGSLRFCSQLCLGWLLGLALDLVLAPALPGPWSPLLTPGPLALVLPLFVPYYLHIPTGAKEAVAVSTKSFTYLLGLQVAASSASGLKTELIEVFQLQPVCVQVW